MKIQAIIASIATLAMAAPASHLSSPMEVHGVQIRSLLDVLKSHGAAINLDVEQLITCNVSYTLSLSIYPLLSKSFEGCLLICI